MSFFTNLNGYFVKDKNATQIYESVANMRTDNKLENGMTAKTLGYYQASDNGGAEYKIVENENLVDDGGSVIALSNGLKAILINKEIYPEMFGAKGDGIANDTSAFMNAINYADVLCLHKKTYKLTKLTIAKNLLINGNDATLIDDTEVTNFIEMTTATQNLELKIFNLKVNCPNSNVGFYINKNKLIAEQITVSNAKEIGVHIVKTGSYGSCQLNYIRVRLSNIGIQLNASDCWISNFVGYNCMTHLMNRGGITHLNGFHGWNFNTSTKDWITDSTLIDTTSDIMGNDIYIDTLENGIKLPDAHQYNSITLQNVSYFLNLSSYPSTQKSPTLFDNLENYTGFIAIDGLFVNENNWTDSNGKYPYLFPNEIKNTSRIKVSNVSNSGFRFGDYKPYTTHGDVQTSEFTVEDTTYLFPGTRKYKRDKYHIRMKLISSLRSSIPTDTLCLKMDFSNGNFSVLNNNSIVDAKFISTSTTGKSYKLDAYISSGILYVYNNTGVTLNNGNVVINIDYDDIEK